MDEPHKVVSMRTGKEVGTTTDPEGVFVIAVEEARARESVFVVTGIGPRSDSLADRIGDRCPVIRDGNLFADDDGAIIVSGKPEEWEALAP